MGSRCVVIGFALLLSGLARAGEGREDVLDGIPTGESWYAMRDGTGEPTGYARLEVRRTDDRGSPWTGS